MGLNSITIGVFLIVFCHLGFGQIEGKWIVENSSPLTLAQNRDPNSATITFKKNGHYQIDLYAKNIFPAKVPWKKYHFGRWRFDAETDSILLYSNFEKWSLKTERQDFGFKIIEVSSERIKLVGRGLEKLVYYGRTEPYEVDVEFKMTEEFELILVKIKPNQG